MKKQHTNYLFYLRNAKAVFAFIALLCGISNTLWSQTTVYSNDFNANETVLTIAGSPSMTWTNVTTGIGVARTAQFGVASNYLLQIRNNPTKDATGSSNIGRTYVYGNLSNFANPFQTTLNSNLSDIIWTFNIRSGRNSASLSFDDGQYASAVVLCASGSNFLTANGYAVTLMKGTAYNAVRLVKFTGGLTSNTNITTIIGPSPIESSNTYTDYFSVKVVYSPATNKWKLFSRLDGASISVDPESGTLTQVGAETIENTYTGSVMSNFGFFFNHGSTGYYVTYFDNFKVKLNNSQAVNANSSLSGLGLTEMQLANSDFRINSGEFTLDQNATVNSVLVAPGAKLTLGSGNTLTATNGITLQSDATGTATILNNGTYTGTITAQQYLGTARNWYVSSPVQVTNSPANNITRYYEYVEGGNNEDLSVTGSTAYWKGLATGTSMSVGKGYIAQASGETTVEFSGTPNNGNITTSFNLTRNDVKGKGFNLVGNPYPSYIDWSLVAAANPNLMSTAWFKTKKTAEYGGGYTFASVNVTTPSSPEIVANNANTTITKYIPPTQAFWIRVKSGTSSTSMSFTNAMREHRLTNGDLMKAPKVNNRSRVRLQLANGIETDETLIYFDKIASNDFNEYDSPKMMNNSAITPDLYSLTGAERLVINGLKEVSDNLELPLGFSLSTASTLKLKATEMSNLPEGTRVYLFDKVQSTQTELTPETEYAFSTAATTNNESRFSLLFKAPGVTTGTNSTEREQVSVFVNTQNQITIIAKPNSKYSIYNAVGQVIENGILNSELQTANSKWSISTSRVAGLQTGFYVVKVNNQSTRLIVK